MKILNRNPEILVPTWMVGRFSPRAPNEGASFDAAFIVKGTFSLAADGALVPRDAGPLQPEGDRLIGDDPALGLAYASDFVPLKPRGEYTIVGTVTRPPSAPANRMRVAVEVAGRRKELTISGPRTWLQTIFGFRAGSPGDVERQPLTYAAALGGAEDRANPIGLGRSGDAVPHIEYADQPIGSPWDGVPPAGFGPLAREWRQRRMALGAFGQGWVKDHWPWLPQGFDLEFFLSAPPDQWLPGFFRGDERLVFENLLPQATSVRTSLPGIRARMFVLQRTGLRLYDPAGSFAEVPLALDTVAVDLDARTVVLVWRGICPVASLTLRDVAGLLLFAEPLDAVDQPVFSYRAWLDEAADTQAGFPSAAVRAEARKKAQAEAEAIKSEIKQSIRAGMTYPAEVREQLAAMAADVQAKTALVGEKARLPDLAPVLAAYDLGVARVEAARDKILALAQPSSAKVKAILDAAAGPGEDPSSAAALRQQLGELLEQVKGLQKTPAGMRGRLQAAVEETIAKQQEVLAFRERLDADLAANAATIEAALPVWAVRTPPDPDVPVDPETARRDGFAFMNVAGFDFTGIDLAGVDFRQAIAADAKFVDANLAGADFTAADLTAADFTGADLSRANLAGADLTTATLAHANLSGANLTDAKLAGLDLSGLDLTDVVAPRADFSRATLEQTRFERAVLERANFTEAMLAGARFAEARLTNAALAGVHAAGADFSGADLTGLRAGRGADFLDACFRFARAAGSVWEEAVVDRADFSGAMLDRANFTAAFGRATRFYRCHLADATLDDSVLVDAVFAESRLLRASLARADLTRARCVGANLFAASLWSAVLVDTDFGGANLMRASTAGAVRQSPGPRGADA